MKDSDRFSKEQFHVVAKVAGGVALLSAFAFVLSGGLSAPGSHISIAPTDLVGAAACATDTVGGCKVVVLTSNTGTCGANCWQVPADLDPAKTMTVQVIGGGGGGWETTSDQDGDAGGGGGAYARIEGFKLGTSQTTVTYRIGAGGDEEVDGGDTWFNRTSGTATTCTSTMSVCAKGGQAPDSSGTGGVGGLSSASIGHVKYSGGTGGSRTGSSQDPGSGGGGAAGPTGPGVSGKGGENRESNGEPGAGGDGNNGSGGQGGGGYGDNSFSSPSNGSNGTDISVYTSPRPGAGGGGSGGYDNGDPYGAYDGGLYGGGGGGAGDDDSEAGSGASGVIVITYNQPEAGQPAVTITATAPATPSAPSGYTSAATGQITVPYGSEVTVAATYQETLGTRKIQDYEFLTTPVGGSGQIFSVPSTWLSDPVNISAIGGGGGGNNSAEGGGGGGAYSYVGSYTIVPGQNYWYRVGDGGTGGSSPSNGQSSYMCNATTLSGCDALNEMFINAPGGGAGGTTSAGIGGNAAAGVAGLYNGGNGGYCSTCSGSGDGGSGGGGAGGPGGGGKNGGNGASDGGGGGGGAGGGASTAGNNASGNNGGSGGHGRQGFMYSTGGPAGNSTGGGRFGENGSGGGGGSVTSNSISRSAGRGGHGEEWERAYGAGGGGGGTAISGNAATGGDYGGGGGSAAQNGGGGGRGAQGIIAIQYWTYGLNNLTYTGIFDDATNASVPCSTATSASRRSQNNCWQRSDTSKSYTFGPTTSSAPLTAGTHTFSARAQTDDFAGYDSYATVEVTVTCPLGYAGDTCNICADNFYMNGSVCQACPGGSYGPSCALCLDGYGWNGSVCEACGPNEHTEYNDLTDQFECRNNIQACSVPGGVGQQTWDEDDEEWGVCGEPITCNDGYELQTGVCVAVANATIDTFTPDVFRVRSGQYVTLTWAGVDLPTGAGACTITSVPAVIGWNGAPVNSTAAGGSQAGVGPITRTTEFTITCSTASAQTIVGIVPSFKEI